MKLGYTYSKQGLAISVFGITTAKIAIFLIREQVIFIFEGHLAHY